MSSLLRFNHEAPLPEGFQPCFSSVKVPGTEAVGQQVGKVAKMLGQYDATIIRQHSMQLAKEGGTFARIANFVGGEQQNGDIETSISQRQGARGDVLSAGNRSH